MAATTTVRVDQQTHRTLQALSREAGQSTPEVLARIVEAERRRRLFARADAAYAAMQADPAAWAEELAERRAWDITLGDGLEAEPTQSTTDSEPNRDGRP